MAWALLDSGNQFGECDAGFISSLLRRFADAFRAPSKSASAATSLTAKPAETAAQKFLEYANMTPAQRLQAEMLNQLALPKTSQGDESRRPGEGDGQGSGIDQTTDPEQRPAAHRADHRHVGLRGRAWTGQPLQSHPESPLCGVSRIRGLQRIVHLPETVNVVLIDDPYAEAAEAADSTRKPMDAQRIAVDAVVALTDCDREQVTAFIRKLYLAGVKDPKRLTFKGLQALARAEAGRRGRPPAEYIAVRGGTSILLLDGRGCLLRSGAMRCRRPLSPRPVRGEQTRRFLPERLATQKRPRIGFGASIKR